VKSKEKFSLQESIWALGIVTGDNKNKIFQTPSKNMEKIYTSKEICQFVLKAAKNHLIYDRKKISASPKLSKIFSAIFFVFPVIEE